MKQKKSFITALQILEDYKDLLSTSDNTYGEKQLTKALNLLNK